MGERIRALTCENGNHIVANGYLHFFDYDDNKLSLLRKITVRAMEKRFKEDLDELVMDRFRYCPICGVSLDAENSTKTY